MSRKSKAILKRALAALPRETHLVFIDYDEAFTDQQCALIVGGKWDEVYDDLDFHDGEDHSVDTYLENAVSDEEDQDVLKNSEADFEAFRMECYERDRSSPFDELLRHSQSKLIRFYIRNRKGETYEMEDSLNFSKERFEQEVQSIAKATGLDIETNRDAIEELINNATYGGSLCVLAYVEMRVAAGWVNHCLSDDAARVKLTFTNPHLLVLNSANGSGHDVDVNGKISVRFGKDDLDPNCGAMVLDARGCGFGYSWDETACPHKPAYKCEIAVRQYRTRVKH